MDWQPIETAPKDGPDILLAIPVFGSEHHPTQAKQFLRWEYAVVESAQVGSNDDLECGWAVSDFTHWAALDSPPDLPQ